MIEAGSGFWWMMAAIALYFHYWGFFDDHVPQWVIAAIALVLTVAINLDAAPSHNKSEEQAATEAAPVLSAAAPATRGRAVGAWRSRPGRRASSHRRW